MADAQELILQGNDLEDAGEFAAAKQKYLDALYREPQSARVLLNLGNVERSIGDLASAEYFYLRSVEQGGGARALLNLGNLLAQLKRPETLAVLQRALAARPDWDQTLYALAVATFDDKIVCAQYLTQVLAVNPEHNAARLMLAMVWNGTPERAISVLLEAPIPNAEMWFAVATLHSWQLENQMANLAIKKAMQLEPKNAIYSLFYIFSTMLEPDQSATEADHALRFLDYGFTNTKVSLPAPKRQRLKIAYISADFKDHVAIKWILALFENYDRSRFHVTLISNVQTEDALSAHLKARVDDWIPIFDLPDDAAFRLLRPKGFDVLIDLSSHTAGNRLPLVSARLAPLQLTAIGTLTATGLRNVDFRIADRNLYPNTKNDAFMGESLLFMPSLAACYTETYPIPHFPDLPYDRNGAITFGYTNNTLKLTVSLVESWGRILEKLPSACLIVMGINHVATENKIRSILKNVAGNRIEFFYRMNFQEFIRTFERFDLCLDSFPYTGATTSIECLLAGVPICGQVGESPISRGTYSILKTLGLADWVYQDQDAFEQGVLQRCSDLDALREIRLTLPQKVRSSDIMNQSRFIHDWQHLIFNAYHALEKSETLVANSNTPIIIPYSHLSP